MKKRIFSLLLVIAMLVTVLPVNVFAANDDCWYYQFYGKHYFMSATSNDNKTHTESCFYCGETVTVDCDMQDVDNAGHYQKCYDCGYQTTDHTGVTYVPNSHSSGHAVKCSQCSYSTTEDCTYASGSYETDGTYHWQVCTTCGKASSKVYCKNYYTVEHDEYKHWLECSVCGTEGAKTEHTKSLSANGDGTHTIACTYYSYYYGGCDWEDSETCTPGEVKKDANNGDQHYRQCSVCNGKTYSDHNFGSTYTKGEDTRGHYHQRTCNDCGYSTAKQYCSNTEKAMFDSRTNKCWKECSVCGQLLTEKKTHAPSGYLQGTDGSEIHSGTCSNCGETATEDCSYDNDYSDNGEFDAEKGHRKYCAKCHTHSAYEPHKNLTYAYDGNMYYPNQHKVTCGTCKGTWNEKCDLSYLKHSDTTHTTECDDCGHQETDEHSIALTATASGNKITVTKSCTDNCGYPATNCGTLTVTAPEDTTYKGAEKPAIVTNMVNTGNTHYNGYSITYYKQNGSGWSSMGYPSVPTNVGTYKAEIYSNVDSSVKASVIYKITPADLDDYVTVTAENTEFAYNGNEYTNKNGQLVYHRIKLEVKDTLPAYQNAEVKYSKDGGATWGDNPAFTNIGTHTVKYRISAGDNFDTITGEATVTITPAELPIKSLGGYQGPFDGNWHYSFGYRINDAYDFSYFYYTGAPWNTWYGEDFTFTFSWTDENGVARNSSFNTKNNTWENAENWPKFRKQNVSDYSQPGHIVNVTIVDNEGNYKPWSGSYSVKIGPAVGPTCSNVETVYDAQLHHLTLMFGIDMDAYECIEYQVKDENGQNIWMHRTPDGISSVPSPYEPAYKDVGTYPVKWRVKIDSDMDGQIGGYNARGVAEQGGEYNSLGSAEIIYGRNTIKITAATLTVTPNDATVTYGDDGSGIVGNGYTVSGFKGSDNFNLNETAIAYTSPDYQQFDDVGTVRTVKVSGLQMPAGNNNYKITYSTGKLNILPKELEIEWGETELFYNGSEQAPSVTVKGIVNNDDVEVIMTGAAKEAGEYNAEITGLDGNDKNNYKLPNNLKVPFTIVQKPVLTVTARDKTITYGDAPSNNGVEITGYVDGDGEEVLSGTLTYTYDYEQFGNVGDGTYEITPAGLTATGKYEDVNFVPGVLTVEKKELGVLWSDVTVPYNGEAQAPTATATGTVNGDEITLIVEVKGEGGAIGVGEYEAKVTGMSGDKKDNYKLPQSGTVIKFSIVKKTVEAPEVSGKDETIRGKNDGGIIGLTTEMEYSADGGETWTKVTDPAVELAPGAYQVRYAETDTSLASEPAEVTINPGKYLTVTLPNGEGYTTSSDEADTADKQVYNDTFEFTVDIKDGYSKGENFKVTANGDELTPNEDGSYTISGIVEDTEVKVEGVVDNTAPTGTIAVSTHQWKEFVKNITFNIFFKNSQTVTITAEDTGSGIKSIEYIACESVLTEDYVKAIVAGEWKPYTAPFAINPDAKVVVYAKITDKAGNVKFISSDGMVFDGTAPVFNGVQDGGEYNEETKFTVTDDNLDKVTVDGVEVKPDENGNYTLPMDNKEHVLAATDKSGNETEITVTLREIHDVTLPEGEGYEAKGEPTVKNGDDYTFEVEIKDGYTKGDDFKVTVNGQEIKPNADGKYVVENVTTDLEIEVSGVEKVKEPAPTTKPTTNVPKTGDEGIFLPLILFMLSGIACVAIIVSKKKFRF